MRIYFSAWGHRIVTLKIPAYAMQREFEKGGSAVARAIAAKNGLDVITVRADSTYQTEVTYQSTLGRSCRGGGWTPTHEIWFSFDMAGRRS